MKSKRLIFLDIDGVLINLVSLRESNSAHPDCVNALNWLIAETEADIVVSSTWRKGGQKRVTEVLEGWGVNGRVVGLTPDLSKVRSSGIGVATTRGTEINSYLERYGANPPPFVILDDDDDMDELRPYLVQTNFTTGLTMADAVRARVILVEERPLKRLVLPSSPECAEDVERMRRVLNEAGYDADTAVIQAAYERWSEEEYAAGWMTIDDVTDEYILKVLLSELVEERPSESER